MPIVVAQTSSGSILPGEVWIAGASITANLPSPENGIEVSVFNDSTIATMGGPYAVEIDAGSSTIFGPGCGTGVSSILISGPGSFVTLRSDASYWYITAGMQDSGWVAVPGGSFGGSVQSASPALATRLQGNRVEIRGGAEMTGNVTNGSLLFSLPAGSRPQTAKVLTLSSGASTAAQMDVETGGEVNNASGSTLTVSEIIWFDGVSFAID